MKRVTQFAVLIGLVLGLLPAAAGAATFQVNDNRDASDANLSDPACDAFPAQAGSQCTLRAAVDQGNQDGSTDTIRFSLPLAGGNTISIGSSLLLVDAFTIEGCSSNPNSAGPCVGVDGEPGFDAFRVENSGSSISGLAITGSRAGISSAPYFTELTVKNNWLGLALDGSVAGNRFGLDLSGEFATVGGPAGASGSAPADRNVIAGNTVAGVRLLGGEYTTIAGNYIGVKADGTTPAGNGIGVEMTGATAIHPAVENTIGGTVSAAAAATPVCDDLCNVISSNQVAGIDLGGEPPDGDPAEQTRIKGNFIGLDVSGSAVRANPIGIAADQAYEAHVGGDPEERNYITGGDIGIRIQPGLAAWEANFDSVRGNFIGLDSTGNVRLSPPTEYGILGASNEFAPLWVTDNRIVMVGGHAVDISGSTTKLERNVVGLGAGGQDLTGGDVAFAFGETGYAESGERTFVTDNVITNTSGAGIQIGTDSEGVYVQRNQIGVGAGHGTGGPGIDMSGANVLDEETRLNVIGGVDEADANLIDNSGGPAIRLTGNGQDRNQILVNKGAGNQSFVDLAPPAGVGNDAASGPNAGIQAPPVPTFTTTQASGTALPGATVRVFATPTPVSAAPTGFSSYLGTTTADGAGNWSLTFGSPIGASEAVTVTQTDAEGNSSEPSTNAKPAGDTTPPTVTITAGPNGLTNDPTPTFEYSGDEPGEFFCKVDGGSASSCDGGTFTTGPLADGPHTFEVFEVDAAGNQSQTETRGFTVDATPPAVTITAGPSGLTADATPTFEYTGSEPGSFHCYVDGDTPVACDGGAFTAASLADGPHTFHVYEVDAAGNQSPVATRDFTVDTTPPVAEIVLGPSGLTTQATPTFTFDGEAGATYRCSIDGGPVVDCNGQDFSPGSPLADGPHTFEVFQVDAVGNVGPVASRDFVVDTTPPAAEITFGPPEETEETTPTLGFAGEPGGHYFCSIDGGPAVACDSLEYTPSTPLGNGPHVFEVFEVDAAGNVGPPAAHQFTIDAPCPPEEAVTPPQHHVDPAVTLPAATGADTTPPDTQVKGPKRLLKLKKAKFKLFASETGARFQCRLDRRGWRSCRPNFRPRKLRGLRRGRHRLAVRAIDAAGNVDPTPAIRRFRILRLVPHRAVPKARVSAAGSPAQARALALVLEQPREEPADGRRARAAADSSCAAPPPRQPEPENTAPAATAPIPLTDATPPDTAVKGPKRLLKPQRAKFHLLSTEPGSHYECKLDKRAFKSCRATFRPRKVRKLRRGKHLLTVRAIDAAGNADPTPAKKRFRVLKRKRRAARP